MKVKVSSKLFYLQSLAMAWNPERVSLQQH